MQLIFLSLLNIRHKTSTSLKFVIFPLRPYSGNTKNNSEMFLHIALTISMTIWKLYIKHCIGQST